MLMIPAIDIIGGRVVRLERGDFNKVTNYKLSPAGFAQKWESEGAVFLHVVDLDGAKEGVPKNLETIQQVVKSVRIPVEVGGGIRTVEAIRNYLEIGVQRVVLSTRFLENPSFLYEKDLDAFVGKIAISIDVEKVVGDLAGSSASVTTGSAGWTKVREFDLTQGIKKIAVAGVKFINFSDISHDGMMQGLDLEKIKKFLACVHSSIGQKLFLTYAGGISNLEDIRSLLKLTPHSVNAVIVGRALYENKFNLKDAIRVAHG
jgi:phosphoribosylformimino-5-aminoimidazole carboxamide ribotide isomerase